MTHERGGDKARLLMKYGYTRENWQQLENDIRQYHLEADVTKIKETIYGTRYEINAVLATSSEKSLLVTTVWQIDKGKDYPRLITLIPD